MANITYTLVVTPTSTEGETNAAAEAAHVKTVFEAIIEDLKISSGMAQIATASLTEV